jgi:hypothetical protein
MSNVREFNMEPSSEQAALAVRTSKRMRLILQHYEGDPARVAAAGAVQLALQQDFRLSQLQAFPGATGSIRVMLYVRRPVRIININPKPHRIEGKDLRNN